MSGDDGWEERMAARARARQEKAEREERGRQAEEWGREAEERRQRIVDARSDERRRAARPWLNGWPRIGDGTSVLIGTGVYCVGCGRGQGITTVAFPEGWEPPGPEPEWPFGEEDCPACLLGNRWWEPGPIGCGEE